jgi:hypothetical protein
LPGRALNGARGRRDASSAAAEPGNFRLPGPGIALALVVALLLFLKNPYMLLWPPLHAEDGTQMLAYYYCPRDPGSILRFYNGYVSLVPNAIGFFSLRAPIELAPKLLALAPFLLTGACFLLPFLLRTGGPTSGAGTAVAASLLLAALPLGNADLVANTTYSFWNGLLALCLLALAPPPQRLPGQLAHALAAALLIASHPLSLVMLPLYLVSVVQDVRGRRWRALWAAGLVFAGIAYQLVGVQQEAARMRAPGTLLHLGLRYLVERVGFEAILGTEARLALYESGRGWVVTLVGALITAGVGWLGWRSLRDHARTRGLVLGLGYLVLALTFGVVVGRNIRTGLLWSRFGEHYFYVPKALLWVAIVLCAAPLVARLGSGKRRLLAAALCAYVLAIGYVERARYGVTVEDGRRIAAFVERVADLEAQHGGRRGIEADLERDEGGDIRLRALAENRACEE